MNINSADFQVKAGKKVKLDKWPTLVTPYYQTKDDYQKILKEQVKELSEQQNLLFASNHYSVLLIFQAMDAAGKDGAIKHVMSGVNPQGCQVFSFKHPSATELDHDFLWRTNQNLPERGKIGIFNRSYYEEVLIVRVHPEILQYRHLTAGVTNRDTIWEERFRSILDHESHLHRNGTRIIKFFLHVSKEEQRKRFIARIDNPAKNWKFSNADIEERKFWDQYTGAYEACLSATSTEAAQWFVVPADDKENARLIISTILLDTFKSLKLNYPATDKKRQEELQVIRTQLMQEGST